MTDENADSSTYSPDNSSSASEAVPFESIPQLAADEDFITAAERLRELTQLYNAHFKESKKDAKDSEYDELKAFVGAQALVVGVKTLAYQDLRITNADGGVTKGGIDAVELAAALRNVALGMNNPANAVDFLLKVAAAAKDFDPQKLVDAGVSPMTVANAKRPDKPRAASIRVSIVGPKKPRTGNTIGGGGRVF